MIPAWKLKREAVRLKVQIAGMVGSLFEGPRNRRYDRTRAAHIQTAVGEGTQTKKVAIFLIFQPNGLPQSVIETCAHLEKNGYSVLAVSNAPLKAQDQATLARHCWMVAQRPNIGYDFGGYRDGFWLLDQLGVTPDALILINDSIWFPIRDDETLLRQIDDNPADFIGVQVFGDTVTPDTTPAKLMYGSYFLAFKRNMLRHSDFIAFWRNYAMSSNKEITLRRGERAFSAQMFATGLSHHGFYSYSRFKDFLQSLSLGQLRNELKYLVTTTPELENALATVDRDSSTREEIIALFEKATRTKNYIGAAPVLSLAHLKFPAIKKNNEYLYKKARERIVQAREDGLLTDISDEVMSEIEASSHR